MTSKAILAAPRIAWPTLFVLAGALALWALGIAVIHLAWPIGCALATLGAYVAFTPMHEAAHRSLARARWLNEVTGRLASVPLFGPFAAIRYIHLEHHKHTNDPHDDPDHWSGRGPAWLLPLRWLTQDVHYYSVYLRRRARRPSREQVEIVATLVGLVASAVVLVASGHGREVVLGWLVPARLAIGILAFAFDYLPHRPHVITAKQDRFAATSAFEGPAKYVATLGQSLHRVHHLYPGVPFYRYGVVWRAGLAGPAMIPSTIVSAK